jgi:hypothetical protein
LACSGAVSTRPESRVERAEEDVRYVVRSEWAFLEDRQELIAVALPPTSGIAAEEQ